METRLRALADASARIFAARSLEETLDLITEAARALVGAHQAVTSLTRDGGWAQSIVSASFSDKYAAWRNFEAKPNGKGIYSLVCAENRPMRLTQAEVEAHPAFLRFGEAAASHPPLNGWLAAPLVSRSGGNLGLIQLSDKESGEFDADDEALIVQLAQLAGLAIENQRLIEAARAAERRFESFATLANEVLWESDAQHRYTMFIARGDFRIPRAPQSFIGKTRLEALGADPSDPLWARHLADLNDHRPIRGFEYAAPLADGHLHTLRVNAEPQFDAAGTFTGYRGTTQDVTELRAAEAAARASEERFRQFAGIASDWLWETDADHRFTFFAGAADMLDERPYGKTRWEVAGADLADPKWQAHHADLAAGRPFRHFEYTRIDRQGRVRHISVSGEPVRGPDGALIGYRGITVDLTARRQAEADARRADERYRTIVETANEGVWMLDAEAKTVFANRRMGEMLGYAPEEMIGRSVYDFRREKSGARVEQRWRARIKGVAEQHEIEFVRRDGTEFWALLSAQPMFDAAGGFAGSLGMVSDITARKEAEAALQASEARFRDFAEVGSDWIWETDSEHRIVMLDGPPPAVRGYAPGKRRWEYGGVDPEAPEWRRHRADLDRHIPFRDFEYQALDKNGAPRHFSISGKPVFGADGAFRGYRGTTRDITAQREAEARLRASEQRFKDFASVASDWMWETDADHRFTYFSPERDRTQPDPSAAALGKRRWDFAGPDLSDPKWQAHIADLEAHRPFRNFEYRYRRPVGAPSIYRASGIPRFAEDGTFLGYRGTATDVTAQRAVEATAQAVSEQFRRVVETANEGIWMIDVDGRVVFANHRLAEMLGHSEPAALIGRAVFEFVPPDLAEAGRRRWNERRLGRSERYESRVLRRDGSEVSVLVSAAPSYDAAGAFSGTIAMLFDITALKRAEAALKRSEQRFRDFAETGSDWLWETDADHRISFFAGPDAMVAGWSSGLRRWEVPGVDSDSALWERHRAVLAARVPFRDFEYRATGADGGPRWISVSGRPIFGTDGSFKGYRGVSRDVTAQRLAEAAARKAAEQYQTIVETAQEGVWVLDADERTTFVNRHMAAMLGYTVEEMIGRSGREFRHPDDVAEVAQRWETRKAGSGGQTRSRFLRKDGTEVWTLGNITPRFGADGRFAGALGMFSDITALKEAEAALKRSEGRFRDFAEIASDWMWETDAQHRLTFISGSKLPIDNQPFGRTRWELAEGDPAAEPWRSHIADLDALRPFRDFEFTVKGRSGRTHHLATSGRPVLDEHGTFLGYRGTTTNRTQQREAEVAAAESERKFRQFVETANEGVWMIDVELNTIYVNNRVGELLGYPAADVVGRSFLDFQRPEDAAETRKLWIERGKVGVVGVETRLIRRDGRELWVQLSGAPRLDAAGEFAGAFAMLVDITDHKEALAALAASEARFRDIAEMSSDWFWETDEDHRFRYFSPSRSRVPGRPPAAVIGLTRWEYVEADLSDPKWQAHIADHAERRPFRNFEYSARNPDGTIRTVAVTGRPMFAPDGSFSGYRGIATDVTRQRQAEANALASERKFRQLVETANEGVWMVDAETKTTYVNKRVAEMLGGGLDEIIGRPFTDFKFSEDLPITLKAWDQSLRTGLAPVETRLRRKDGSTLWVLMSAVPQRDEQDRFAGYFAMMIDITDRKAAEWAADRAKREVDAILASISDGFVAFDNEWRFTYANAAAERIIGTEADVPSRSASDLLRFGEHTIFEECYLAAKRDGTPVSFAAYSEIFGLWLEVRAYPHPEGLTLFFRDVTAERLAQRALAQSERNFRQLVETANEGLWITNRNAEVVFANYRIEQMLGYAKGELVGKSIFDTLPPDRIEEVRAHWRERASGRSGRFEARHLRKDGSEITMLLSATPMYDGAGAFAGSFVMFVDISEQRRVQQALEESEKKLLAALAQNQSVLASISDGFVALDNEWRFTFINAAAERMWNRKAEDLLGKTILDSLRVDHTNPFHANYIESKRSGEPTFFTAFSDLFGLWLEVRGYPHPGGFTFFFHDVSEERRSHRALLKSQRKLQAAREMNERLFETSLDLICIADREGNFVEVNSGTTQQFGYAREDLIGRNASEFIDADGIAATREGLRAARKSQTLHTFENHCRRKDGGWVPMNWSVAWSEREQKYYLIGRDMSERIAAQERLNRSQRLEAVGQLTGRIAHDFNNLLTVIMGNTDALASGLKENANLRRRAELSLEAARRAAELTAQLLAFARRQTLAPKAIEANKLVRDLHELIHRTLGAQIEIELVPGPAIWLCKVDATQLETALINLAVNARDAMPTGGRLTITTSNRTVGAGAGGELAAGDYVAIEVADTGVGMEPEVVARAFEPFFTTKDIGKGSGLGLAMVYGFAKQSGGGVTIESEPGRGTKVTLYLPREHDAVPPAKAPAGREGAALPGGSETILVVEDDAAVREIVTDQLTALGYRVLVAGNGPIARNFLYGGEKIDLLFTDVMMPGGMTGTELAAEAERQLPGLMILFTTGYSEAPALQSLRGGVALLRKPYKSHDLARIVRETLDAAA